MWFLFALKPVITFWAFSNVHLGGKFLNNDDCESKQKKALNDSIVNSDSGVRILSSNLRLYIITRTQ